MCGEAGDSYLDVDDGGGPSPRVRGSRTHRTAGRLAPRSIPACAGKPRRHLSPSRCTWVHPRVCGEAGGSDGVVDGASGPSPRVRGSHGRPCGSHLRRGSIPACAGKPAAPTASLTMLRVHPRVCGEASATSRPCRTCTGPSPRVRGSRRYPSIPDSAGGSIPACAGKPHNGQHHQADRRVHPRVCGEALAPGRLRGSHLGPSPRVRGSLNWICRGHPYAGSIPACAGKPPFESRRCSAEGVHPRVCGEASMAAVPSVAVRGPSPRVRGSPARTSARDSRTGSIPACAGKPFSATGWPRTFRVHPRVCGEAIGVRVVATAYTGPSPRVRGSRTKSPRASCCPRSIPACAGKPRAG